MGKKSIPKVAPTIGMRVTWADSHGNPINAQYIGAMVEMYGLDDLVVSSMQPHKRGWLVVLDRGGKPLCHKVGRQRSPGAIMQIDWKYLQPL